MLIPWRVNFKFFGITICSRENKPFELSFQGSIREVRSGKVEGNPIQVKRDHVNGLLL